MLFKWNKSVYCKTKTNYKTCQKASNPAVLCSLPGAVEEEGAEDRDPHTVPQHCQVDLSELKRCWVLIPQLPHTVQEQQEQRRL